MTFNFGGWSGSHHDKATVDNPTYYIDSYGKFGVLDIDTGARQVIKSGFNSNMDIAGTANGGLYGIANGKLYSIDPSNGNLTTIGSTPNVVGFGASGDALFGASGNKIYSIDPQTGASTEFATFNGTTAGDLVVVDNALYITTTADQLIKYDLATGQESVLVANLPGHKTYGIAVDSNGDIVGVTTSDQGYKVNVDTGAVTLTADVSGATVNDMASISSPVDPVDPVDPTIIVDGENFGEVMNPEYNDANNPTNGGGDIIDGADGNDDIILGNGGDDTIDAGLGNDQVAGGSGDDVIDGNVGDDLIYGDNGLIDTRVSSFELKFAQLGADGSQTLTSDGRSVGVSIDTPTTDSTGWNIVNGLLQAKNVKNPTAANIDFDEPVSNVALTLGDVDGLDEVRIVAKDANGNEVPVSFENTGTHSVNGNTVFGTQTNSPGPSETNNGQDIDVIIQGPITSLEVYLDNGPERSYSGIVSLEGLTFDVAPAVVVDDGVNNGPFDDVIDGGAGNDIIYGDNGEDLATGGSFTGPRESFNWDLVSDSQADSSVVQDTGDVKVTYTRIADTGKHESEIDNHTSLNTAGIDSGSEVIDTNSSLESTTNGNGNEGAFQWNFDEPVGNLEFNINDLDGDGVVNVTAYGPNGVEIPVNLVGGSDIVINGNTATAVGPFQNDNDPDVNVQVTIPGPVTQIVLEHDQVGSDNSGIHITDMYFDTGFVPGADGTNGEGGDDIITGSEGADTMFGEGGDDTFIVGSETEGAGDVIVGGNGPDQNTDYDVLDLRGAGQVNIDEAADQNDVGATAGTVTFENGSTLEFSQIEEILQDTVTAPTKITITPVPGTPVDDEGRPLTAENGAPAQIVVSLDAPALEDTVITLTNDDPTETDAPTTVTILAGETSVIVDVPSVDDPDVDGTQIAPISAEAPGLTGDTIEVAVADDDVAVLTIEPVPGSSIDDAGNPVASEDLNLPPAFVQITRTGPTDEPLVVTLTSDDTTEATVQPTVTIPAGQTTVIVPVLSVDDPDVDGTQFPTITAEAPGFDPVEEVVAVLDNDVPPTTITITPAPGTPVDDEDRPLTAENGAPAQILVSLDAPALEDTVITLTNDDPSETNAPTTVTILAGETSVIVDVPSVDDPDVDGTQIAPISATAPGLTGDTIEVAVADDDVPELTIAPAPGTPVDDNGNPVTAENGDPVTLEITRTGPTDEPLVVTLNSDDTTEGTVPQTVTIPAGQDSVTFEVTPVDDPQVDGTQTPTITATADGFEPVEQDVAVLDDDAAPTKITIAPAPGTPVDDEGRPVTAENGEPAQIVVSLDAPALEDTVITLTNDDPTETDAPTTVTILAGETSVIVDVPSVDDPDVDGTQIAPITATAPGLTPATVEVAVEDDDVAVLTIEPVPGSSIDDAGNPVASEDLNLPPAFVQITRTGPTDEPLVVTLTSDDTTEATVQPTVTIPAGQTTVIVPVLSVDDPDVDGTQFPTITAEAPGFDPVEEVVAVLDNDVAPTPELTIAPAPGTPVDDNGNPVTAENGDPVTLEITRTGPTDEPLVVTLNSDDTTEGTVPQTVTIPAGQDSVTFEVTPVDDPQVDGTQTPTITATADGFEPVEQDVAVLDDDVAPTPELTIAPAPGTPVDDNGNPVTAENGDPVTLEITRTGPTDEPLVVTLNSDDTTEGTVPQTVTISAGQDSVTFEVTPVDDPQVDGTQTPTITATADGFEPVEQDVAVLDDDVATTGTITGRFTVDADGNDSEFNDETQRFDAGVPGVTVELLDVSGNVVETTVTRNDGTYTFNVVGGAYQVKFPSVDGKEFSEQNVGIEHQDSDADENGLTEIINLSAGDVLRDIDAGVKDISTSTPQLTIAPSDDQPVDANGNPVTAENGDPVELVITRTGPTDEPLVVTLTSDDPTEGTVPVTVTIPAGETSVPVEVTPIDDPEVDGTQFPTITATAPGFDPVEEVVAVGDDDVAPTPVLTIAPSDDQPVDANGNPVTEENGDPVELVITRTGPTDEPLVVTLTSDDPTEGTVPVTVTIPAGETSVPVEVTPIDDPEVDGTQFPTITATAPGFDPVEEVVAVGDDDVAPTPVLTIAPSDDQPVDANGNPVTAENGDPVELVITRTGPTDEPLVVTLTSDDPTEGTVPVTVTIPAGETSVPVEVTPIDDPEVDGTQTPTITATAPGFTPVEQDVVVMDDDVAVVPTMITIEPAPNSPVDSEGRPLTSENGAPAQIVVSLDAPALVDTVITLTNDDASETNAPTTVTILAGQTSVLVDVPSVDDTDVDGTQIAPITATAPGLTPATVDVAVADDDVATGNLPPVAVHDVIDGGMENTPETIKIADLLVNDSDPEGKPFTVVSVQAAKNGTVEYDADTGEVTFTPNDGFVGLATFTYTIADDKGLEATAEVCVDFAEDSNPGQVINGNNGNNFLIGTDGDDTISGRGGDDLIQAGAGDDMIQGGKGDDVMDGGLGADTFVWELSDLNFGSGASSDTIFGFEAQDTLDVSDLLQGEEYSDEGSLAEALDNYMHFSVSDAGDTVINVSALGSFQDGNNAGDDCIKGDQLITLSGVDLTAGNSLSDVQIINSLLTNNQLITD